MTENQKKNRHISQIHYEYLNQVAIYDKDQNIAGLLYCNITSHGIKEKEREAVPVLFPLTSLTGTATPSLEPKQPLVPLLHWGESDTAWQVPFTKPFLNTYGLLCSGSDQTPQQDTGLQDLGENIRSPAHALVLGIPGQASFLECSLLDT